MLLSCGVIPVTLDKTVLQLILLHEESWGQVPCLEVQPLNTSIRNLFPTSGPVIRGMKVDSNFSGHSLFHPCCRLKNSTFHGAPVLQQAGKKPWK